MNLDTNTSLALMNATQPDVSGKADEAKNAVVTKSNAQIETAAKDFEAMFMTQMLKPMFEGLKVNDMFGGGKGEEVFSSFLIDEYGKMMAETGQLGIADAIKAEMIKMQSELSGAPQST